MDSQEDKPIEGETQNTNQEPEVQPVETTIDPEPIAQPVAPPVKHTKRNWIIFAVLILAVLMLASAAIAIVLPKLKKTSSLEVAPAISDNSVLLKDRAFIRYVDGDAYEKDEQGGFKRVTNADGSQVDVRKPSFTVEVEYNGEKHDLTLTDKIFELGSTTEGEIYALSCDSIAAGVAGAENVTYTASIYSKDGQQIRTESWKERDMDAPTSLQDKYCSASYFNISGTYGQFDLSSRGYGQELVDDINYKIVYMSQDGMKQDVATETSRVVDLPLGVSPDKKTFLYNRVSAKRVSDPGCGGEAVTLPYKIPDYSGPINELHAVDLETKKDTNIGSEKSFGTEIHPISLRQKGYFSKDGARYYLREGVNGGCAGGYDEPLRIAYIDLRTKTLQTIESPEGKIYTQYCFTSNKQYILEYTDSSSQKYPSIPPSILDTASGEAYQHPELTDAFYCNSYGADSNLFIALDRPRAEGTGTEYKYLNGIRLFNPDTREYSSISFDVAIDAEYTDVNSVSLVSEDIGAVIRKKLEGYPTVDPSTGELRAGEPPTVLFDIQTGRTIEVPYTQIVL